MKKTTKILFIGLALAVFGFPSYADRGVKPRKSKVSLNINTVGGFSRNLASNLKCGLQYTGSTILKSSYTNSNGLKTYSSNSIITYKKGNTVYIVPYKQKIIVPEARQGYAGIKLIIKTH